MQIRGKLAPAPTLSPVENCAPVYQPKPNCSEFISQDVLKEAIIAAWPVNENGVATISYSFKTPFILLGLESIANLVLHKLTPQHPKWENSPKYQDSVRYALNNWSAASNGKLKFVEKSATFSLVPADINFYLADVDAMAKFGAGAFTIMRIDNNGKMHQANVFYPNNEQNWDDIYAGVQDTCALSQNGPQDQWATNMVHHELGHVAGFAIEKGSAPSVSDALKKTPEGMYCSVMPYDTEIDSDISECAIIDCHPDPGTSCSLQPCTSQYAYLPGPLDKALIDVAYTEGVVSSTFNRTYPYFLNALHAATTSIFYSGAHQAVQAFFSNVALRPYEPILPKRVAWLIADGGMLVTSIVWLEFPYWAVGVYALTSATKYVPENVLNKLPERVKYVATSHYNNYVLNLVAAYLQGQKIVPLLCTGAASLAGSFAGGMFGSGLGRVGAWMTNKMLQPIVANCFPRHDDTQYDTQDDDIEAQKTNVGSYDNISDSQTDLQIDSQVTSSSVTTSETTTASSQIIESDDEEDISTNAESAEIPILESEAITSQTFAQPNADAVPEKKSFLNWDFPLFSFKRRNNTVSQHLGEETESLLTSSPIPN